MIYIISVSGFYVLHIQILSNCCRHKYDYSISRIFRLYFLAGFCNLSRIYTTSRHYWHHPTMHCAIRTRSMNLKSDLTSWLLDFCCEKYVSFGFLIFIMSRFIFWCVTLRFDVWVIFVFQIYPDSSLKVPIDIDFLNFSCEMIWRR